VEPEINYKQELIGVLIEINLLVTQHLNIQKSIFNPPVRAKLSIPFIQKKINFENLYEANKGIQTEIYQTIKSMQKDKKELNIDPFIYGGIKDYALLFHTSSEKLSRIIFELHLKSKKQNKLSEDEYNQLVNEYQVIENSRMKKGNTIQKIVGILAQ
jgi:hypothetical protein